MPRKSTARKPKATQGGKLSDSLGKSRQVAPKEREVNPLEALQAQLAELTKQLEAIQGGAQPKAASKPRKGKTAKQSEGRWSVGTTFTYVKKDGSESQFRITDVVGKRAHARNVGTGFASKFKLTTLDALFQSGNIKL